MISSIISRIVILVFGTLYPAYASYKAVKTKNIKEYLKWMMYWIVFALFTCIETFTDIFLSWFPFYYEIKILLVLWLLSPATKGSSILYRKFVHPMFSSREEEIDEYIAKAKEQSYKQVLDLGQKGVTALMQTALKSGGGIVNHIRKSYSLSDLSTQIDANHDETDDMITVINDPQLIRRRKPRSPMRSNSTSASVYFAEIDVATQRQESCSLGIRSIDDISSGYSSGEALYAANQPLKIQARESISSHRTASLSRSRSSRGTRSGATKKSNITSDDSDENEIFDTNIIFLNDKAKKIEKLEENISSSSSETEFFDIPDSSSNYYYNVHEDRIKPIFSYNTKLSLIENNNLKESDYLPNDNEVSANIFGYDGRTNKKNNEIVACKNTRFSSASLISVNLSKLSSALTSLYPSFSTRDEHLKNTDSENKIKEIKYSNNSINENKVFSNTVNGELEQKNRGGKYNKKHAPLPPSNKENLSENPIKAKLVLQPGVVRSLNSSTESLHKEIFLNYSPKVKRRSRINKSPTSRNLKNSDSSSVNKGDNNNNAFSRMLQLPKKMPHLNLSSKVKENRNSWSEFLHTNKKLIDSRIGRNHSKSANSLLETNNKNNGQQILRSESELSVKNLTESSSMVNRRLRVIRRN